MQTNSGIKAFTVGTGGVTAHSLVKLSSGEVVLNTATSTDDPVGVALYGETADGVVAVHLINCPGTVEMIAAGAISSGADVYAAADGEIQSLSEAAATYRKIGIALEAATADGDIIEVLPYDYNATATVTE